MHLDAFLASGLTGGEQDSPGTPKGKGATWGSPRRQARTEGDRIRRAKPGSPQVLWGAWPPSFHLKSPARCALGRLPKQGGGGLSFHWKSSRKQQRARSPQNSPHGSFLIGFNYFPTNCIFKSFPWWFLNLRISSLLSGLEAGPGQG